MSRLRGPGGDVPLTVSYDVRERVWNPPMPLLFQRSIGSENRAFTPSAIRKLLINALAATNLIARKDPLRAAFATRSPAMAAARTAIRSAGNNVRFR